MALDTVTGSPDPYRRPGGSNSYRSRARNRLPLAGSRLGRLILLLNLLGLLVLIVGALVLNEFRRGLIEARLDSLTTQGQLLSYAIVNAATEGEPEPAMNHSRAVEILTLLGVPRSERARLYDQNGKLLADTDLIADKVLERTLPPAAPASARTRAASIDTREARAHAAEVAEVRTALAGQKVSQVRESENGGRLVSVSIPIQHVSRVLGVLTLEAGGVDDIVAAQRRTLAPFILIAVVVTIVSSILLDQLVARPVLRLARAADRVRLSRARAMSLPDLAGREDEIGDLTRSLEGMTETLSGRLDAIERFAADVSHELKNPLTSIRSAVETLEMAPPDSPIRDRLTAILKSDVRRMDRLITDISNASRVDADLSREAPKGLELDRLLADIVSTYHAGLRPGEPSVQLDLPDLLEPVHVVGREAPLGQVFRNLIDNARSFSPAGGQVRVKLVREAAEKGGKNRIITLVEDDGPGIPADNLETVFQRFYTSRPKGQAFGGNSGLGLSIARQIVEAHGGAITAANRLDDQGQIIGARFTVDLPESAG
jgi:two-component system sensor histidine kinase ChvG